MSGTRIALLGSDPRMLVNFRLPLVRALREAGHEVIAIAPGMDDAAAVRDTLGALGVRCLDVPMSRAGLDPIADLKTLAALHALFRRERPDRLLSYTVKPVVWGTVAGWLAGVPHRAAMLTGLGFAFTGPSERRRGVRRIVAALLRAALSKAHLVIFHNADDEAEFRRQRIVGPRTRSVVVDGSGIDLSHFAPVPLPAAPPLRFLMVSRLIGDKGARDYLDAVRLRRAAGSGASFALVGDVDPNPDSLSAAEVEEAARDLAIDWVRRLDDVRPAIARAHVLVLPSHREGLPRAVLEAMAMGRAILTTDAPGCRETVVDGENGLLVPVADPVALAAAMAALEAAPTRIAAMGDKSLELARARFSVERVNAAMLAALDIEGPTR